MKYFEMDGIELLIPKDKVFRPTINSLYLAEEACKDINSNDIIDKQDLKVVDIGTGSGFIAMKIFRDTGIPYVLAIDAYDDAYEALIFNRDHNGFDIEAVKQDGWGDLEEKFDYVVACLPCFSEKDYEERKSKYTEDYESIMYLPKEAYCAGETGYEVIEKIISGATTRMSDKAWFYIESPASIPESFGEIVKIFEKYGFQNIQAFKDHPNLIKAQWLCANEEETTEA